MKTIHRKPSITLFLTGVGLPLFLLSATLVYEIFLLAIVFAPDTTSAWGGFVQEFKQWCFNFDPETGHLEWIQVAIMLVEPPFIATLALLLWLQPLRELGPISNWLSQWKTFVAGTITAVAIVVGLFFYGKPPLGIDDELPFPGERIRTSIAAPNIPFIDHKGSNYQLADSKGKVTLVTGIYATCSTSCPLILLETKALLESLPEDVLQRLDIVAISLSPEYDTHTYMDRTATAYGLEYPQFRYVNGDPELLNKTTRSLGFSRSVDPETGVINHANLFLVLDANGDIAYRLTLDNRHKEWLRKAVISLSDEIGQKELAVSNR